MGSDLIIKNELQDCPNNGNPVSFVVPSGGPVWIQLWQVDVEGDAAWPVSDYWYSNDLIGTFCDLEGTEVRSIRAIFAVLADE